MLVYYYLFFATRIQINVSWSESGPGQMIRIQPDPDPKHWLMLLQPNLQPLLSVPLNIDVFVCLKISRLNATK